MVRSWWRHQERGRNDPRPPMKIGGNNANGPKVGKASLSKIWLYAGKSEYPPLLQVARSAVKMREVRTIRRKGRIGFGRKEVVKLTKLLSDTRESVARHGELVITGDNHLLPFHGCPSRDQNRIDSESSETVRQTPEQSG